MNNKIKIHLLADSLCCDYSKMRCFFPQRGWGQYIGKYFDEGIELINHARPGFSIKAFLSYKFPYTESKKSVWESLIYPQINKCDYVIISSNINDKYNETKTYYTDSNNYIYHKSDEGYNLIVDGKVTDKYFNKSESELKPVYTFISELGSKNCDNYIYGEYENNMLMVINDIIKKGATPVLVTAPTEFIDDGNCLRSDYQDYLDAVKIIANDNSVTYIDLHSAVKNIYANIGNENARLKYNMNTTTINYWQKQCNHNIADCSKKIEDNTHFCIEGAQMLAKTLAALIREADLPISKLIVNL